MLNFKSLKEMKKVLLICVVALALASCGKKAAETVPAVDTTAVAVDTTVVDTTAVDTTVAPVK
jgi:PBP1b-binding outer membrane lipoprotein LpoB